VYVDGLKGWLHATVTVVAGMASGSEHEIVVILACKEEPQALVDAVAQCFPNHVPAAIRKDALGWAQATCADHASHELVVAAVGVIKASGGWDESSPIIVDICDNKFEVFMEFRDKRWQARVQRSR
jgi:hypothetical protein